MSEPHTLHVVSRTTVPGTRREALLLTCPDCDTRITAVLAATRAVDDWIQHQVEAHRSTADG